MAHRILGLHTQGRNVPQALAGSCQERRSIGIELHTH